MSCEPPQGQGASIRECVYAVVAAVLLGHGGVVCQDDGQGTVLGSGRAVDTPRLGTANDEGC